MRGRRDVFLLDFSFSFFLPFDVVVVCLSRGGGDCRSCPALLLFILNPTTAAHGFLCNQTDLSEEEATGVKSFTVFNNGDNDESNLRCKHTKQLSTVIMLLPVQHPSSDR